MTDPAPAVHARDLRKRYGELEAVAGVDVNIPRGTCFGFLGPNGAGKSTTMRMIYRATAVDSGELQVLGHDATTRAHDRAIKSRLGVVHQENNLDEELTVRETLEVFCRFHRLRGADARRRVDELLAFAELTDRADSIVITLSGGMKRRLMVARGLVGDPDLVVLDEPTTGLDPRARQTLWDKLTALRRRRATLILTTHYMDEAERLCDRIAVMDAGRIVAEDAPQALIEAHAAPQVVELHVDEDERSEGLDVLLGRVRAWERVTDRVLLYDRDAEGVLSAVLEHLPGREVRLRRGTLDDVFLRLTGHGLTNAAEGAR